MPAALSHLKKINKCQLQCKHLPWLEVGISKQGTEGLWGWQGRMTQELQLLEDMQRKIMGVFLTEGKDRANPQSSQLRQGTQPDSCSILLGGKPPLGTVWSAWELSSGLTGFLLQPIKPLSSRSIPQGHLQVWVQVLPSHLQAAGGVFCHHIWFHKAQSHAPTTS